MDVRRPTMQLEESNGKNSCQRGIPRRLWSRKGMEHFRYWSCKPWQEVYKKAAHYPSIPKSKCSISLQDFHSLHPVFTVMLYKPLVALFMVFAATGGVAASLTPVRRGGGHPPPPAGYPPPPGPTVPAGDCNTNTKVYCCDSLTSTSNPIVGIISGLLGLGPNNLAGLNCIGLGILSNNPTW